MGYFDDAEFKPEAGSYQVIVNDASAFVSKDGDEFAKVVLEVREGEHKGRVFEHFMGMNHPVGRRIAMEALVGYGLDISKIDDFGDLMNLMPSLISTQATATVSYNAKGYMDVHVFRTMTGRSDVPSDTSDFQPKRDQRSFQTAIGGSDDDEPPWTDKDLEGQQ